MTYTFAHGAGTSADPYQVWTADDLNGVRDYLTAYFKQMADIDLSNATWNPIENFNGNYNGNKKLIQNMSISEYVGHAGLFGVTVSAGNAQIYDLGLTNIDIDVVSGWIGAGIVGHFRGGTIARCFVTGSIDAGSSQYGAVAGIAGQADTVSIISDCYFNGTLICTGTSSRVGGIVAGLGHNTCSVNRCFCRGNLVGYRYVGGIIADIGSGSILGCFVPDNISVTRSGGSYTTFGRISGKAGIISNCHAFESILEPFAGAWSAKIADGKDGADITDTQAKQQSTYNNVEWDFEDVWTINSALNDGYPFLKWQLPPRFGPRQRIWPQTYPLKYPRTYP
jgi:hypothetical protein